MSNGGRVIAEVIDLVSSGRELLLNKILKNPPDAALLYVISDGSWFDAPDSLVSTEHIHPNNQRSIIPL